MQSIKAFDNITSICKKYDKVSRNKHIIDFTDIC
jgi:hypothetical protein